jgi:hypothetical protein
LKYSSIIIVSFWKNSGAYYIRHLLKSEHEITTGLCVPCDLFDPVGLVGVYPLQFAIEGPHISHGIHAKEDLGGRDGKSALLELQPIEKAEFSKQVEEHPAILAALDATIKGVALPFERRETATRLFVLLADQHLYTLFGQVGARDQPADS